MNAFAYDLELDTRGMSCPLPIVKTRGALKQIAAGQILRLQASDPGSVKDVAAFCQQTGNELMSSDEMEGGYTFLIRKN